jgi:hypothetical protein
MTAALRASLWYAAGALSPVILLGVFLFVVAAGQVPRGSVALFLLAAAVLLLCLSLSCAGCACLFCWGTNFFKRSVQPAAACFLGVIFGLLGMLVPWLVRSIHSSNSFGDMAVPVLIVPLVLGFVAPVLIGSRASGALEGSAVGPRREKPTR